MKKQVSSSAAMNSRRRNVSVDSQTDLRGSSRLSADELLLKIPIDLVIEIFSRLPLKSIARCRCVSKRWASILRRPDFTELFFTKSVARPQLLFASKKESEVIFFSSPQPQNPGEDLSPIASANHQVSFPFKLFYKISGYVNGYVCISQDRILKGRRILEAEWVICNPSTGQSITLPIMKTSKMTRMRSFLGYDPIEKQHKVLAMTMVDNSYVDHQVLTLRGDGNLLTWRLIECDIPHSSPGEKYICINGVLYYTAKASDGVDMIVCFDVRSEKYSSVKFMVREMCHATLINFQGKLASLMPYPDPYAICETSTSFEMWILQDPEKHEWDSKRIFSLPPTWKDVVAGEDLFFKGVTATNEFVFSQCFTSNPYYVYYYNLDKETITRVEIQGRESFKWCLVVGINHVTDVKLM